MRDKRRGKKRKNRDGKIGSHTSEREAENYWFPYNTMLWHVSKWNWRTSFYYVPHSYQNKTTLPDLEHSNKNVNDLKITSPRLFYVDKYDQALEITSKLPELYELKTHNISEQDKM